MSYELNRRALLRLSAYAGAGALTFPMLTGQASATIGVWSIVGASASHPVGTATLEDITVTRSTAANSAQYISDLVVKDFTVGGLTVGDIKQTG